MSFPIQVLMNSILINNQMLLQNISDPTTGFFEFRSRGYYIAINKFDSGSSTTIYFEDLKKNSKGKTVCDDFTLRLFDMVDAPSEVIEWLDEYNMEPGNFISLSLDPVNPNRDPLMLRPEPIITDSTVKAVTKVKTAIANHNPKPWSYLGARTAKAIKACKQARSRGVIVNGGIGC